MPTNTPVADGGFSNTADGYRAPNMASGASFVTPRYGNAPWHPYAGIADQLTDARSQWSNGAGGFANNAAPIYQAIRNFLPQVGGGLLGSSAYSGGQNPFRQATQPTSGFNPYAGRGWGGGGGGLLGGGQPGYGQRPPGDRQVAPPYGGGYSRGTPGAPYSPIGGGSRGTPGAPYQPGDRDAPRPGPTGGAAGVAAPRTGLLDGGAAGAAPAAAAPPNAATGATSDVRALADQFMATDPAHRGNFFNAVSQYGLGRGGSAPGGLGGALQVELRNRMGQSQFSNWLTGMDNRQGSTVGREGLPSWLASALGG